MSAIAAYLAVHAIGLGIVFMLLCMVIGQLAMHVANKETGRAWQGVARKAMDAMEKTEESRVALRHSLDLSLQSQRAMMHLIEGIERNTRRPDEPLMGGKPLAIEDNSNGP